MDDGRVFMTIMVYTITTVPLPLVPVQFDCNSASNGRKCWGRTALCVKFTGLIMADPLMLLKTQSQRENLTFGGILDFALKLRKLDDDGIRYFCVCDCVFDFFFYYCCF